MPLEIERKFLVVNDDWRAQVERSVAMRQGYLVAEGGLSSVRVRVEGDQARLNIKAALVGPARAEYDYAVPVAEGLEILETLCVGKLEKTRHWVIYCGTTWEVDVFEGENQGLIVAEVELEREDQTFELPSWLGAEVTDQRRYYNHALVMQPFNSWNDADRS